MCVKFQLSVSESSRDIKGIVVSSGSVCLQTREWQFDPDSAYQSQFPSLPPTAAYIFFVVDSGVQRVSKPSHLVKRRSKVQHLKSSSILVFTQAPRFGGQHTCKNASHLGKGLPLANKIYSSRKVITINSSSDFPSVMTGQNYF